jgi:hypothetical protein
MARLSAALVIVLLLAPVHVAADAQIGEWIGEYAMNHDGHQGTLRIEDSKRRCRVPAWCHLVISYLDTNGARFRVNIRIIDQAFQHMVFDIAFPGNVQRFDAYLMSWDKTRMAGTTRWQGRTFGFYAIRRAAVGVQLTQGAGGRRGRGGQGPPAQGTERKTINADGEVQTALPDGSKRLTRPGVCGSTIVRPDGTKTAVQCNQVQPATPPIPDQVSGKWLDAHNSYLLDIIRTLLGNDQPSLDNYLRTAESSNQNIYDKIRLRTSLIAMLTSAS